MGTPPQQLRDLVAVHVLGQDGDLHYQRGGMSPSLVGLPMRSSGACDGEGLPVSQLPDCAALETKMPLHAHFLEGGMLGLRPLPSCSHEA